jgi:hypothetical protein
VNPSTFFEVTNPEPPGGFFKEPLDEMLVAGSCRSFPQDSRNSYQIYVVKRMIRGLGVETTLTYSQTLNM